MSKENYNQKVKTMERKKFFSSLSKGFIGLVLFSSLPFRLFGKKDIKRVEIKINPQAVSRKKDGRKNG